ncbi:hypothetical protein FKM82_007595 [Ascaphus truei]
MLGSLSSNMASALSMCLNAAANILVDNDLRGCGCATSADWWASSSAIFCSSNCMRSSLLNSLECEASNSSISSVSTSKLRSLAICTTVSITSATVSVRTWTSDTKSGHKLRQTQFKLDCFTSFHASPMFLTAWRML